MLAATHLKGSMPALVTPFDANNRVDAQAFSNLIDTQIAAGSHGLVPCGTTGESPTLSHEEHKEVVELCVRQAAGRVPVIAGSGSNSTAEAIELTRHAASAGADAALVVTPYYNKPSQDGLYAHFHAIHEATEIPILIYNIPGRSIVDMNVETMRRLAELPRIIGVKDATADMARLTQQRMAIGENFRQVTGEDGSALAYMAQGGHGCISVSANVAPALCAQFQEACMAGEFDKALPLHEKLMPLHVALFASPSPAPAKYALSLLGQMQPDVRLPILPPPEDVCTQIRAALTHAGLLN